MVGTYLVEYSNTRDRERDGQSVPYLLGAERSVAPTLYFQLRDQNMFRQQVADIQVGFTISSGNGLLLLSRSHGSTIPHRGPQRDTAFCGSLRIP
jgi:hypothetical protein